MTKAPGFLEGMLASSEGRALQALARDTSGPVVEIGSHKGKSSAYLARGIQQRPSYPLEETHLGPPRAHTLYCVDVWRRFAEYYPKKRNSVFNDPTVFDAWEEQVTVAGVRHLISPLEMSSADAHKWWTSLDGPSTAIGLLFIDAAHDYENARRDYDLWSPYVETGGIIAFHDYGNPRWPQGVTKVVNETIARHEDFKTEGWLAWATKK